MQMFKVLYTVSSIVLTDMTVSYTAEGLCWVTEVNWSTCWSVELSRLEGCAVCDCQGVKTERSVPSSSQLLG